MASKAGLNLGSGKKTLPGSGNETYLGDVVYNFFDNLLPDNVQIRARIQQRFSADTNHPFDILSSIGQDCVGALQLYDAAQAQPDVHTIKARAAEKIMSEMFDQVDAVIAKLTNVLPESFPQQIAGAIFTGMRCQRDKLVRGMK